MLTIHRTKDCKTGLQEAATALSDAVSKEKNSGVLLLFSGGSPLEMLQYLPNELCDDRVTVGVSDERFSTDPTINNFAQVRSKITFKHAIDTRPVPGETLEQMGVRFDTSLKIWRYDNPNGKIVITQGIGLDGHTAGMMPYPEQLEYFNSTFLHTSAWAVGYDAKDKNKYPQRITTTIPFLQIVDMSIVFACGEDKQKPVEAVFSNTEHISEIPGRIIHHMRDCQLFTDRTW